MKFENRRTQFPGRKKVKKLNSENQTVEEYFVVMENAEGKAEPGGTPVSAANLNKGNWRDDTDLSFKTLEAGEPFPTPQPGLTQIYTRPNGETWIVPPSESSGEPKVITDPAGSLIEVGGKRSHLVEFERNPQDQITENSDAIRDLSADLVKHTGNFNNPHAVTKETIGLGNADNTSDADKPLSLAQQSALNAKLDIQTVPNTVYAIGALNNNFQQPIDGNAGANTIPIRRSNGAVATAVTPSANDDCASKQYVDNRPSLRRIWRYNVDGKGSALDIGPQTSIDVPSGISEGDMFHMHVHRGGMRQMYTGVWSEGTMEMILSGDAGASLNDIPYLHRIRMWVAGGKLNIRSEVAMVTSSGSTNWRTESAGIFYMLFLIVNKAVN